MVGVRVPVIVGLVALLWATPTYAQSTVASPPATAAQAEAAEISAGWTALAAGQIRNAINLASQAVARYPRSLAAAALLIQAQTAGDGAAAGLAAYDQWLGSRTVEDPYLLRIVALGMLREAARTPVTGNAQRKAIEALLAEGDQATLDDIRRNAQAGEPLAVEALGRTGDEPAVRTLITSLAGNPADRPRVVAALGATRSPLAVEPLIEVLSDPSPANQIAAADALGQMGARAAIPALRAQLSGGGPFAIRFAVGRALFRLNDPDGTALMRQLENSEAPMIRAQALEATSSQPDPSWVEAVRRLLTDPDPQVRLLAARLAAPHDPAGAGAAVRGLLTDGNLAIREAAMTTYSAAIASDFPSLRQLLWNTDALVRVHAAGRILELTR